MKTFAAALLLATVACTAEGDGTLAVRIYGEAFIEEGIPADAFNDGWSITFSRYLVAIDDVATDDLEDEGRYLYDLTAPTAGEGQEVTMLTVPSGGQHLGFRVTPSSDAPDGGNATAADATMMAGSGISLFVEGTATKADQSVSFAWGISEDTTYRFCEVVDDVPDGGEATTTITIHTDHIFYDDLESPIPNTSFDLIAASDADMNGEVTEAELRERDISAEARYQVGSQDIYNLWDYMSALSRTIGHVDGEGECQT